MPSLQEKPTGKPQNSKALLGPVAIRFGTEPTGTWRTHRPEVNQSCCVGCAICAEHCPTGVIDVIKTGEMNIKIEWFNCKGCGICANVCPQHCIQMIPEEGAEHA